MNVVGIIPARQGSKRLPGKNIRTLLEKPLINYTIHQALESKYIKRLIVSTDDEKIAQLAREAGAEAPFIRPRELAGDEVTDYPVFQHCLNWLKEQEEYEPDIIVHLRPTAPLRKTCHIDQGIELLSQHPEVDSVRSVVPVSQHPMKMWMIKNEHLIPFQGDSCEREIYNLPKQKLPKLYVQNGSVDVVWSKTITQKKSMTGDKIFPMVMDIWDSVNIDDEYDFFVAEAILKKQLREMA